MTLSRKIQAGLMLASALGVAAVIPAFAASDTTDVTLTITSGALSIDIPNTSYALSGVTLATTQQTSTATISDILITDTRGTLAGWASNTKLTNLVGQTDNTKLILLASESPITTGVKYLTVTNSGTAVTSGTDVVGDLTEYNSAQLISSLSSLAAAGESNTFNLLDAPAGFGAGTYTIDVGLDLKIPPFGQYPGTQNITAQNYQGTFTASVA
jgi:hypothetical protein